jgi:ESCRT-II complex subunit VPS36
MVSPVTRLSAGRQYHQELARQIADLLLSDNRLRRLGGMVALSDVYCLYNRARGMELVSPSDLYEAAQLMEGLRIGKETVYTVVFMDA